SKATSPLFLKVNLMQAYNKVNLSVLLKGKSLGLAEGKSLGLVEGEARGSHQKALETARILKQLGDSRQKIVQVTGLTIQEVEKL
ncbi:MAG: hypothetical protein ACTTH7_09610, partial [Treponema sp.]